LQVGAKYFGCVVCRFHIAADAGSAPYQKPASINLQKWFLSTTGRLNLGFTIEGSLPLCSSHLPLWVPNWAASTANTLLDGEDLDDAALNAIGGQEDIFYEEPDLSWGVEIMDYAIRYEVASDKESE
jgi:hypothetical protein